MNKKHFEMYKPDEHAGKKLFTVRDKTIGDNTLSVIVPVIDPKEIEEANKVPWFYFVEIMDKS
jgi:hypothetical protein